MTIEPRAYIRKTLTIVWEAKSGRRFTRRVDLGHVGDDSDLEAIAVLNVGTNGNVVSYTAQVAA